MAGHGGARAGAGRKPRQRVRRMVSFRLHEECIEAIKARAEQAGQSQSAVVELALGMAGIWTPGEAAGAKGGKDGQHS